MVTTKVTLMVTRVIIPPFLYTALLSPVVTYDDLGSGIHALFLVWLETRIGYYARSVIYVSQKTLGWEIPNP